MKRTGEHSFTIKKNEKTFSVELSADKLDFENRFMIEVDSKKYHVELTEISRERPFRIKVDEAQFQAEVKTSLKKQVLRTYEATRLTPVGSLKMQRPVVEGAVTAPMTGKVVSIMVEKGVRVKSGQVLCILEAMKMENEITASRTGTVQEIYVTEGSSVKEGEVLLVVN